MSRKSSSVYESSSFDAVESTRRLSEEIAINAVTKVNSLANGQREEILKDIQEVGVNCYRKENFPDAFIKERMGSDSNEKGIDDDDDHKRGKLRLQKLPEELIENGKEELAEDETMVETKSQQSDVSNAGIGSLNSRRSPKRRQNPDAFEQRSVSDSDLDSPDDFWDGGLSEKSGDYIRNKETSEVITNHSGSHERSNQNENSILATNDNNNQSTLNDSKVQQDQDANITTSDKTPIGKEQIEAHTPDNAHVHHQSSSMSKPRDGVANDQQPPLGQTPKYGQLSKEEIDSRLKDAEVIRQGELLDTVRQVGISNLNKLQHLNWNDPALRRLFTKPKISTIEVGSVKVDPDIKNLVNEFLKTNVTENFVISRVLRENYAMFYSWLASHLQTERNAWTTRFAQALEQADQERKTSLHCRHLVVEAGTRLCMLVKTSSNILFGIPSKEDEAFFKFDPFRRSSKRDRGVSKLATRRNNFKNHRDFTLDGYTSDGNAGPSIRAGVFRPTNNKKSNLAPSNYRLVDVAIEKNQRGNLNYESDPGESGFRDDSNDFGGGKVDETSDNRQFDSNKMTTNNNYNKYRESGNGVPITENGQVDDGYDLEGLVMDDDNITDWNQVLADNIDVLTDIIDTLLVDRKSCLSVLKANPKRCESLVDAVSSYIKHRNRDVPSQRDVEKRLRTLENENRALIEEMGVLQKTLAEKNQDALNLQTQLDRLESTMKSYSAPKVNKCVGTGDEMFPAVFKNNLTVGGNKTPRQNNPNSSSTMPKLTKSPRHIEKEVKVKKFELPDVNGISNAKHTKPKRESNLQTISNTTKDKERKELDVCDQPAISSNELSPQQTSMVREPSLIEISEEKLKTLKHRAKKLEDSLHDAISSMERFNKSTHQSTGFSSNSASPFDFLPNKSKVISKRQGPNTFRKWKKASFEVSNKGSDRLGYESSAIKPRVAMIKRSDSFSKQQQDSVEQSVPEIRLISMKSEPSSLLEGRSIPSAPPDLVEQTPVPHSSLRMTSDRGVLMGNSSSRSIVDDCYTSDDERSRPDNDAIHTYRRHVETKGPGGGGNKGQGQAGSNARRTRARHNASRVTGGRQAVSKCLRCQKLFSPTDNHKLACCYHTKDKERMEHYDQSGMLLRVMYAWKCCHEPQESEGCCYGQHV